MGTPTVEGPIVDILPGVTQYDTYFKTLPNGRSVFGYEDQFYSIPDDPAHVYIVLIDNEDGSVLQTVQLSQAGGEEQITVSTLADNRFLVGWWSVVDTELVIKGRIFNADGSAAGSDFVISGPQNGGGRTNFVTLADGRILLTWENGGDSSGSAGQYINGQLLSANGQLLGENFTIFANHADYMPNPQPAALAEGGVVFAWTLDSYAELSIHLQITNDEGKTIVPAFTLNSKTISASLPADPLRDVTVVGLADGTFLVAWTEVSVSGLDLDSTSIQGQIVGSDGKLIGDQFLINTTTVGLQSNVSILALDNGGFVAIWHDGIRETNSVARGQYFLEGGAKSGAEFLVVAAGEMAEVYSFDGFKLAQIDNSHILVEWREGLASYLDHFQIIDLHFSLTQIGTDASDTLLGTRLNDTIFGGLRDDSIIGNFGLDSLAGDAGNDVLQGDDGDDLLFGGVGNDQLFGGTGIDRLTGGVGDDIYEIDTLTDQVIERLNEGTDKIIASGVNIDLNSYANIEKAQLEGDQKLNLTGSAVGNELIGNGVANYIDAGAGGDLVFGGAGNDVLSGGVGIDRITGGAGADFFVFRSADEAGLGAAADQITDFTHGVDQLVVTAFAYGSAFIGAAAFSGARQVRYDIGSGVISGDNDGNGVADWQIVLLNKPVLTAIDLIL